MEGLRQAYVLGCLLCFGAQSWMLMPCNLLMSCQGSVSLALQILLMLRLSHACMQTLVLPS